MGLRERKAERTRAALHTAVIELAEQYGYEAVTVEQIATHAEVGTSTLYRYFPSKDAILLAPIADSVGSLAARLDSRPPDESLETALEATVQDELRAQQAVRDQVARLRAQLDTAPGPRARLWDLLAQQRGLLEAAIARRAGVPERELWVCLTAHQATTIIHIALDRERTAGDTTPYDELAEQLIDLLAAQSAGSTATRR
ncbi:TetR family transcriptional regulator [Microlunatus endophyticus]|uniref:TetR family transcriptional regulator n=1 Tax=Microlunatus endophyticus TaxID=1716077 RepID=A0A917S9W1_9ACTN|nr:TetR/AcrR family transcriptional regulator [Microlunatus endophyticus]GGL65818.1 TetR family transcriptional regulator [Microlunatus endophyticus]